MADHSSRSCPYDHANIFSKITFWWMNALFKLGFKNQLSSMNICDVSKEDESNRLELRLERYWKKEVQKYSEGGKASLFRAVLLAFKWQWILPGILVFIFEAIKLVQPFLIGLLVAYFNSEEGSISESSAYGVGACLGLSAFIQVCVNPTYFFIMQHVALRMKVAVGALIYRKVLSLSTEAFQYTSSGQIVNHLSTDIEKFNSAIDLLHYFWVSPLSIIIVMYLMYRQVGVVCFWGLAVVAVIVPIQAGLSSVFGKLRQKIGACSDRRIQLMSEIIIAMRVIKMHCWEQPFQHLVSKLRSEEIFFKRIGAVIVSFNSSTEQVSAKIVLLSILASLWLQGVAVPSSAIYSVFTLCETLKYSAFYYAYYTVENNVQLYESLFRLQEMIFGHLGAVLKSFARGFQDTSQRLMAMAIIIAIYWADGQTPLSAIVFTVIGWLESIRLTGFFFVYFLAENISQLSMSLDRVKAIINGSHWKQLFTVFSNARKVAFRVNVLVCLEHFYHLKTCHDELGLILSPLQQELRSKLRSEMSLIRWSGFVISVESGIEIVSARLSLLAVVIALWYNGISGAADIFTTIAWLSVLQSATFRFPTEVLKGLGTLQGSAELVQTFLLLDEEKEQIKDLHLHRSVSFRNEPNSDWAIDIDHVTARWPHVYTEGKRRFQKKRERTSTSSTKSLLHESDVDHSFSLKYISLQVKKGELLAVVGVVGSGKSSLLMALIGELPYEIGQIALNGRISYCGQTNWVFSGTVRDNILFGHALNRNHYQKVINACGLKRDLDLLPKGDQTFVGERGLQLSGGQKARLSLARSVYHDADIFLMDDPLSAVDTNVGKQIFQRCVLEFLKDKTVVLVTHQLQYLKQADRIAVLRDGSLHDIGTYDELKSRGMDMRALTALAEHPKQTSEAALEAEEEEKQLLLESKFLQVAEDIEQKEEEVISGTVGFHVYWQYFNAGFGMALLPFLLPFWFAGPALFCLSDWKLAEWVGTKHELVKPSKILYNNTAVTSLSLDVTSALTEAPPSWDTMPSNMQIYIIALVLSTVAFILYAAVYLQMAAIAGRRLHERMILSVMNSVSQFFDTHPVGQVLNRFSRDLGFIDDSVSQLGYVVSIKTTHFLGFFLVTVIVNPWLTIAVIPVMAVIVLIRLYALRTLRQVKRLEAKARSPVYSHVSDTILGLETIRALGKRDQFLAEFDEHQNSHTSAWFLYLSSYRWMSVRSMAAVVIYMNIIIFVSLALKESLNGNLLALSLIYCIAMAEPFEWYMRVSADLETHMTSVERVLGYCKLPQEPPKVSDKPPSPDWPIIGAITFTSMSLKYSPGGPYILKKIDCHIRGKEKVGIVGRTGSGKSSLINSLFRLAQPTGSIYIDGVDTEKLGLHELRSKISVIPQDPILFSQTLRWNLDPLEEFSDERLWNALDQVQMKKKIEQMPGKLYTELQEGGHNLSVGQRQLICLARAILKYNRILILDEATANVDQETDDIIQRTIRAKFRDSTVLTIAHRLYTVMDCDRIMVLDDGELREFDSPYNLLQKPDSVFVKLVSSLGKSQAKQLQALAELSQHQRTSASLQLQRAVLLANEQLAQSTEDLTAGRAALSWNRFTHSQDSLDKAQVESIVEPEKKAIIAPSQRIIRRRSPGRSKKTIDEEEELMKYETPPKTRQAFSATHSTGGTHEGNGDTKTTSHVRDSASLQNPAIFKSVGIQERKDDARQVACTRQEPDKKIFESDVDFEPSPRRSSSSASKKQQSAATPDGTATHPPRQVGRRVQGPPSSSSHALGSPPGSVKVKVLLGSVGQGQSSANTTTSPKSRGHSGTQRSAGRQDQEKEEFV